MRRERLEVEREAVAGPVGGEGQAVDDLQRLGDVAVEAEAVGLEVAAVRGGGEEVHGQVVRAVGGDRQVEGLGQVRDLA